MKLYRDKSLPQPEPSMPLIAIPSTCEEVHKWAKKQRDSDMAWFKAKVEGMPLIKPKRSNFELNEIDGAVKQREACKSYMLEGK